MKVKILGQFEYQISPETDNMIEVSDNDLLAVRNREKCFDIDTQTVIIYDNSIEKKEQEKQQKIAELKAKLYETDYQAIKYAEGQIDEVEYEPIKVQRQAWRDEINQLEK